MTQLESTAREIRRKVIDVIHASKSPHVGSCLSCVDILTVLYFRVMKLDPWDERDIFILSKGHAAASLYCTLVRRGIMEEAVLAGYYRDGGTLPAHLDRLTARGIEASAGSLGHGFNIGLGMACAFKKQRRARRVFAVIGDGESQEGSIWEGALFAPKLGVDNFTVIVDYNNLQGYGRARELCAFEPLKEKWEAFGWCCREVRGHDLGELEEAVTCDSGGRPKAVIARTTKGKGVSFMEDKLLWHYYLVTDEVRARALEELG